MSFFDDVIDGSKFENKAAQCGTRAVNNINNIFIVGATPYYDVYSNLMACAHPFLHTAQLLLDISRLAYGGIVLIGALMTWNLDAATKVALGIIELLLAIVVENLNIIFSVISIITRLSATIGNHGYVSTSAELSWKNAGGSYTDDDIHEAVLHMV